jgi:hypothetical protein
MKLFIQIGSCLSLAAALTGCKAELAMPSGGVTSTDSSSNSSTLSPLSPAASASHILSGRKAYDSEGGVITGTLQEVDGSKSAMNTGDENDDTKTSVEVTPSASQLFQKFTIDLGAEFKQENICSGKTIFGRLGTAACALAFGSGAHRTPGSATQRDIPVVATDDDGFMGDNPVTRADTSSKASCGTSQATIAARISDCAISWDGEALGKMGEGKWSLVTKASGHEVWKDERTGMLWGGNMGGNNWCQASGNIENDGGIDCSPGNGLQPASPVSMCAEEAAGLNSDGFDDPKGGMRKVATPNSPSVSWRLPTRRDYFQAYANGMAYVLPGFLNTSFWTASVGSSNRFNAWFFYAYGIGSMLLGNGSRGNYYSVRCVGR